MTENPGSYRMRRVRLIDQPRPEAITFFDGMVGAARLSAQALLAGDLTRANYHQTEAIGYAINVRLSPQNQQGAVLRRLDLMKAFDPGGAVYAQTLFAKVDKILGEQAETNGDAVPPSKSSVKQSGK